MLRCYFLSRTLHRCEGPSFVLLLSNGRIAASEFSPVPEIAGTERAHVLRIIISLIRIVSKGHVSVYCVSENATKQWEVIVPFLKIQYSLRLRYESIPCDIVSVQISVIYSTVACICVYTAQSWDINIECVVFIKKRKNYPKH